MRWWRRRLLFLCRSMLLERLLILLLLLLLLALPVLRAPAMLQVLAKRVRACVGAQLLSRHASIHFDAAPAADTASGICSCCGVLSLLLLLVIKARADAEAFAA